MKQKTLYLMCGVPGSGKTFWAKHFCDNAVYVSRDDIRFKLIGEDATEREYFAKETETFHTFVKTIQYNLDLGKNVCADATHVNWISRKKLLNALRLDKDVEVIAVFIDAPLEVCLQRNASRTGLRKVPEDAIKRMYNRKTLPSEDPYKYAGIEYVQNGVKE